MTENRTNNAGNQRVPAPERATKKVASRKPQQGSRNTSSPSSGSRPTAKTGVKWTKAKPSNRRTFIIGVIILIVVFDVGVLGVWAISNGGKSEPPSSNPVALIQSQLPPENIIPEIGYDSSLTFATHPEISIANASSMKPIENNLYKRGAGPGGSDLLYDALAVNRVLRLNTDWIQYLNQGNENVFESVSSDAKYPARQKLIELGNDSQIAFHRIALGEISHIGNKYYILAQVNYILIKSGQQEGFSNLFVYELIRSNNTLVITNFEQLALGASSNTAPSEPDYPVEDTTEGEIPAE